MKNTNLTNDQVIDGMGVTLANARRYYEDAVYLIQGGRYTSAANMLALSESEIDKIEILPELLDAPKSKVKALWEEVQHPEIREKCYLAEKETEVLTNAPPFFTGYNTINQKWDFTPLSREKVLEMAEEISVRLDDALSDIIEMVK